MVQVLDHPVIIRLIHVFLGRFPSVHVFADWVRPKRLPLRFGRRVSLGRSRSPGEAKADLNGQEHQPQLGVSVGPVSREGPTGKVLVLVDRVAPSRAGRGPCARRLVKESAGA